MVTAIRPEPTTPDFEALCTPLRTSLQAKAMHLTRDPQAALDLVQDTFLHALIAWSSFRVMLEGENANERANASASAWMHRILMNQFISSCRMRTRHHDMHEAWPDDIRCAASAPETVEQTHERLSPAIARAIDSLDPIAREIVTRIDLQDEGYPDVARKLGLAVGTVKSKLHRARKQLAEAIERPRAKVLPPPRKLATG